jgi:hypothetical protein
MTSPETEPQSAFLAAKARSNRKPVDPTLVTPEMERLAGVSLAELTDLFLLGSLKGFGPQKFKQIHKADANPAQILSNPDLLPISGAKGAMFRAGISTFDEALREACRQRAACQILRAHAFLELERVTHESLRLLNAE